MLRAHGTARGQRGGGWRGEMRGGLEQGRAAPSQTRLPGVPHVPLGSPIPPLAQCPPGCSLQPQGTGGQEGRWLLAQTLCGLGLGRAPCQARSPRLFGGAGRGDGAGPGNCPPGGRDDAPRQASEGAHAQAASCLPSLSTRPTFRVNAVAVLGRRPRPHGWNMLVPGFEPVA